MGTETLSSATHKCVLVVDHAQPTGIVVNIASVLSMTLGCEVGNIVSHDEYEQALSQRRRRMNCIISGFVPRRRLSIK